MLIDISVPVGPDTPIYPGDPPVLLSQFARLDSGDPYEASHLCWGLHTGTHLDAPRHYFATGATTDAIPLTTLIGPAWVLDATEATDHLDAAFLERLDWPAGAERVLFRTRNGTLWERPGFQSGYIALAASAARWLVERNVRLVGIDYLSIAPFEDPAPTHQILLAAGVVVLEGLDLRAAPPGPYTLLCLPLALAGVEGAPRTGAAAGPRPHA